MRHTSSVTFITINEAINLAIDDGLISVMFAKLSEVGWLLRLRNKTSQNIKQQTQSTDAELPPPDDDALPPTIPSSPICVALCYCYLEFGLSGRRLLGVGFG